LPLHAAVASALPRPPGAAAPPLPLLCAGAPRSSSSCAAATLPPSDAAWCSGVAPACGGKKARQQVSGLQGVVPATLAAKLAPA